jgi:CRP-like cAMP-binding protein
MEKSEACLSCEFDDNLRILREIRFFSGLPLEALKVLAYLCTRETFKPTEHLFSQDDDDGRAFYFVSGKAKLVHRHDSGEMDIRDVEKGDFLGGLVLMGHMRRLFSLVALTDTTCIILTREKFTKLMAQFPELTPKIFKSLIDSLRIWEEHFLSDPDQCCEACRHKIGVSLL